MASDEEAGPYCQTAGGSPAGGRSQRDQKEDCLV